MFAMSLKTAVLAALCLSTSVTALPIRREVPQEHSHEPILTAVRASLQLNNPDGITDPVFALLGNAAAAGGAGKIKDLDCLQQATADQAFTNAKKAKDVQGQVNALIFRALERNTAKVGQASNACKSVKAVNPEIAAIQQHQDPASENAAAVNKAITLELAKQIKAVGGNPQDALKAGTFAPGNLNDNTGKGNSCDDANNKDGCIFTEKLLVPDATPEEIDAAVGGKGNQANESNGANGSNAGKGNEGANAGEGKANEGANSNEGNNSNQGGANGEASSAAPTATVAPTASATNCPATVTVTVTAAPKMNHKNKNKSMHENKNNKDNKGGNKNDNKNNGKDNNMNNGEDNSANNGKNNANNGQNNMNDGQNNANNGQNNMHDGQNNANNGKNNMNDGQNNMNHDQNNQTGTNQNQNGQNGEQNQNGQNNTGAAASGNVQKFGGALGGATAPAVTPGGRGFQVEGQKDDFLNQGAALGRSCDVQHNKCANIANSAEGKAAGLTVGQCDEQNNQCRALIGK